MKNKDLIAAKISTLEVGTVEWQDWIRLQSILYNLSLPRTATVMWRIGKMMGEMDLEGEPYRHAEKWTVILPDHFHEHVTAGKLYGLGVRTG